MSIASLVLGIIAFIISFIPLLGLIAIFPAITAIVLAIVDLVKKSKTKGISITGLVLSGLSLIIMIVSFITFGIFMFDTLKDTISNIPRDEILSNIIENNKNQNNSFSNTTGSNSQNSNNNSNNSVNDNNSTTSNSINNSGNSNNSLRNKTYSIGETATVDSLKVTCISADTNFQNYNEYANIRPGYTIIKADFEFENVGTNNIYISFDDFDCYADYEDYDYFYSVNNATFSASLPSGEKYQGSVYFQIPSNADIIVLEYEPNTRFDREIRFVIK